MEAMEVTEVTEVTNGLLGVEYMPHSYDTSILQCEHASDIYGNVRPKKFS